MDVVKPLRSHRVRRPRVILVRGGPGFLGGMKFLVGAIVALIILGLLTLGAYAAIIVVKTISDAGGL